MRKVADTMHKRWAAIAISDSSPSWSPASLTSSWWHDEDQPTRLDEDPYFDCLSSSVHRVQRRFPDSVDRDWGADGRRQRFPAQFQPVPCERQAASATVDSGDGQHVTTAEAFRHH